MQPQTLVETVVGLFISAPFMIAGVRAILFFGEARATARAASEALTALKSTLERFTEEVGRDLRDHEGRIRVLEDRAGVPR
jgi:hypothetical protein